MVQEKFSGLHLAHQSRDHHRRLVALDQMVPACSLHSLKAWYCHYSRQASSTEIPRAAKFSRWRKDKRFSGFQGFAVPEPAPDVESEGDFSSQALCKMPGHGSAAFHFAQVFSIYCNF